MKVGSVSFESLSLFSLPLALLERNRAMCVRRLDYLITRGSLRKTYGSALADMIITRVAPHIIRSLQKTRSALLRISLALVCLPRVSRTVSLSLRGNTSLSVSRLYLPLSSPCLVLSCTTLIPPTPSPPHLSPPATRAGW
jgi:hypothetical protein